MPAVTPYLCAHDARAALDFYHRAFGAQQTMYIPMPDGRLGHAEMTIGDATIMLCDEFPEIGVLSPRTCNGTTVTLNLAVDDVDSVVAAAVEAGATLERPVTDEFYGWRMGTIRDPFGHRWMVGTEKEHLSAAEIEARAAQRH